jgi:hypothetical protein
VIYEKSTAGQLEITGDRRALSMKHRQVLIMVDGKRTDDEIKNNLPNMNVAETIADLERLGYIYNTASPAKSLPAVSIAPQPAITAAPPEMPISAEQLAAVKEIMVTSTNECLGIMGRGMAQKIEAVQNRGELKVWVSQWHMAIRESRLGKPLASVLMEQVQYILENPIAPAFAKANEVSQAA